MFIRPPWVFVKEKGVVFASTCLVCFDESTNQILKLEEHFKSNLNNWMVFCALPGEPVHKSHDLSSASSCAMSRSNECGT